MANDLSATGASIHSVRALKKSSARGQSNVKSMNVISVDEVPRKMKDGSLTSHDGVLVFKDGKFISVFNTPLTSPPLVAGAISRNVMSVRAFTVDIVRDAGKDRFSVLVTFGDGDYADDEIPTSLKPHRQRGVVSKGAWETLFGDKLIPYFKDTAEAALTDALWVYLDIVIGPMTGLTEEGAKDFIEAFLCLEGIPIRDISFMALGGEGLKSRMHNYIGDPETSAYLDDPSTFYIEHTRDGVKAAATKLVERGGEVTLAPFEVASTDLRGLPRIVVAPADADMLTCRQAFDADGLLPKVKDILQAYQDRSGVKIVGGAVVYKHKATAKHAILMSDGMVKLTLPTHAIDLPCVVVEFLRIGMVHLRHYLTLLKNGGAGLAPFDTFFPMSPVFIVGKRLGKSPTNPGIKRICSKVITLLMSMWTNGQVPVDLVEWYHPCSDLELLDYLFTKLNHQDWMTEDGAGEWHRTIYIPEAMEHMYQDATLSGGEMAIVESSRRAEKEYEEPIVPMALQCDWFEMSGGDDVNLSKAMVGKPTPVVREKKMTRAQREATRPRRADAVATCYNCGGVGHIARFCQARPRQEPRQQTRRQFACYSCGDPGHRSVDCPARQEEPRRERQPLTNFQRRAMAI